MKGTDCRGHLSDQEFGDLLAGAAPDAATKAHLCACQHCRSELASVQESLGSFHALGTTWARAEAPLRVPSLPRWTLRLGMQPTWSAGLTATAMAGVLAFGLNLTPGRVRPMPIAQAATPVPTNAELAADNRLMVSIDEELSSPAQLALGPEELKPEQGSGARPTVGTVAD